MCVLTKRFGNLRDMTALATTCRSADVAVLGADVLTLDPARPRATAIAFAGDRIVAVGDDAEVREACDARTTVVGGEGMTVVPGLVDSHIHPLWGADLARGIDLSGVTDREGLRDALRGTDGLKRGFGLDYAVYGGHELDGRTLEQDAGGPALVSFFDLHTHLATPSVLAIAGVDGPVEFPDNSTIVVRDGVPTGELRELGAYRHVDDRLPQPSAAERRRALVDTLRQLNAQGLTGGHAMDGKPETFALLRELEAAGELTLRLVVPLWVEPDTSEEELAAWVALRDERGKLWRAGVAKFFADGVVESGTAWLESADARGGGQDCFWPDPQRLRAAMLRFARAGFQLATHAIGDRAVRFTLDAYRDAAGVRHRIEHAEVLPDDLLARFAAEGVVASMQPLHGQWRLPGGADEWTQRLSERATPAWRAADVLRSGALLVLGSDWPVAPSDPRLGLAYATGRGGFDPEQALDPLSALAGYTTAAAAAVGEQHLGGRIAPGLRADLTAFAADPTRVGAHDLPALPVRLTVVGGRIVHHQ